MISLRRTTLAATVATLTLLNTSLQFVHLGCLALRRRSS